MEEQAFWSWFCQTGEPLAYLFHCWAEGGDGGPA